MRKIILLISLFIVGITAFSQSEEVVNETNYANLNYQVSDELNYTNLEPIIQNRSGTSDVIITDNVFLKGLYVEVGIAACGCFGTTQIEPTDFHGNMGGPLGFIADPDKDGWDVGSPAFNGEYFLPGSPEEGFGVEINNTNYGNYGKCGTNQIPMTAVSINYTDNTHYAIWEGLTSNGLHIINTTFFENTATFFMVKAQLINTTDSTMSNVYYMRNVDPDNENKWTGNYTTDNAIVYQPGINSCNKALVSAIGQEYGMYLGLGAADSRARVTYGGFSNRSASAIYNAAGILSQTGSNSGDEAISISFFIGDLDAGDTATVLYSYILDETQLDAAMSEMIRIMANGIDITNNLVYSACEGTSIDLEIVNGDDYTWVWSPNLYLNNNTGTRVIASPTENITYTVSGTSECSTTMYTLDIIISEDNENPVITDCPENKTYLLNEGVCAYQVYDNTLDPNATDNCYLASLTHDYDGGGSSLDGFSFPVGVTSIKWTAVDGDGNKDSCIYTITVNGTDDIAPVANCQDVTLSIADEAYLNLDGSEIDNGSYDNCGISNYFVSPSSFSCNDLGPQTVTLTVVDGMGNSNSCVSTVTVVDNVKPVAVLNNKTVFLDETGNVSITVSDIDSGSWDNCAVGNMFIDKNTFGCIDTSVNLVNFVVSDVNGNCSTEIVYVTVLDTLAPIITDTFIVNISGNPYTLVESDLISDNCNYTSAISGQLTFDCDDIGGVFIINVSATDVNGNYMQKNVVIIVDNLSQPVPDLESLPIVNEECSATLTAPTATDNCDTGVITATTAEVFPITESTMVTWVYTDLNGNSLVQMQEVVIEDTTEPEIVCPDNYMVVADDYNQTYIVNLNELNPVSTFDNCEVANVLNDYNFATTLENAAFNLGTTTVQWLIADVAGNEISCSFNVTVDTYVNVDVEYIKEEVSVYPNPNNGNFTLKYFSSGNSEMDIIIVDVSGKIIYSGNIIKTNDEFSTQFNLNSLQAGVYHLILKTNSNVFNTKLVITGLND